MDVDIQSCAAVLMRVSHSVKRSSAPSPPICAEISIRLMSPPETRSTGWLSSIYSFWTCRSKNEVVTNTPRSRCFKREISRIIGFVPTADSGSHRLAST